MKNKILLAGFAALMFFSPTNAQTLNVTSRNATFHFDASQTGIMQYSQASSLTIQGRVFDIPAISSMNVTDDKWEDNVVSISYTATGAHIDIAGNIAQYVDFSVSGGHIVMNQSEDVSDSNCGEITYILSGESNDGSFTLNGKYKATIELHGLSLINPTGAAIDIENSKRIAVKAQEGTVNNLSDGASGSQKAALYCKGHIEFKQKGTINITGNKSHAIAAKEYISVKNTTINVLKAQKDGINCNQYFLMESGCINIKNTGDDGIQVAFKDDSDREADDTGTITIRGGALNITVSAAAAKPLKADGDFVMTGGSIEATATSGGLWDSEKLKTKASACIGADGNLDISGGSLNLTATGGGGKGISIDGDLHISGGDFNISTEGGMLAYVNGSINNNYTGNADNLNSDYKSSPKGIKVDGNIVIDGGNFLIQTKGAGGEGLESKKTLTINDGTLVIHAYEDGTNSSSHTYLNGGDIEVTSKTGDAIDSNGAIYVKGGTIRVFGAGGPEQGFDAGDNYTIYFNGGTILAAGGGNSAPTNSQSTQAYVVLSKSLSAGTVVTVSDGGTTIATFQVPASYGSTASNVSARGGGGGGNWNWGWGGTTGSSLIISTPEMISGKSYTIATGTTSTTATARLTGGSSGPGVH